MRALRWGLLLPCSLLAGYLAYLIGGTVNRFTTMMFAGPPPSWPSWLAVSTDVMAHMYIGLAATYSIISTGGLMFGSIVLTVGVFRDEIDVGFKSDKV